MSRSISRKRTCSIVTKFEVLKDKKGNFSSIVTVNSVYLIKIYSSNRTIRHANLLFMFLIMFLMIR